MGRNRREILSTGLPVFKKKKRENNPFTSGSFICQQHDLKHKYDPAGNGGFEICHAGKNENQDRPGNLKGRPEDDRKGDRTDPKNKGGILTEPYGSRFGCAVGISADHK